MKKQIVTAIAIGITGIFPGFAQEENANQEPISQESNSNGVDALAALGDGCHDIQKPNGSLKSMKVVGSARISMALGATKGLQIARQRAKLAAQQEFIEWIKTNVKGMRSSEDETVLQLESGTDGPTESGKSLETDKRAIASQAEGLVRGLTLIGKKQDNETLTLVFGWSSKNTDLARQAEAANNKAATSEDVKSNSAGNKIKSSGVKNETVKGSAFDEY
jgi:hypothetical protein